MAGDWIKVEVATLDKPEVMRLAELLGIKRDEAIGLLVRFWTWLDRATGNGLVTHTSRKGIDEVMHCSGFAAAFEAVGWGKFNDSAVTLEVVNYSRHNGSPAKTRALGKDRKREHDERKRNADTVTREEKRRVTTTSLRSVVVEQPTEEHRRIARERGVSADAEFQKYRDWMASTGKRHKDQNAGFRNWLKNALVVTGGVKQDSRAAAAAQIFGAPNERVIDGEAERVA